MIRRTFSKSSCFSMASEASVMARRKSSPPETTEIEEQSTSVFIW